MPEEILRCFMLQNREITSEYSRGVSRNYLVLSHSYLRLVQVFVRYVLFGFCR